MTRKIIFAIIISAITIITVGCAKSTSAPVQDITDQNSNSQKAANMTYSFPGVLSASQINNKEAVIETSKGTIKFDLFADKAPKTVSNFIYLAQAGFYNGLTFHRVEPGFVVQGGDPTGTGSGGPGYQFPDESVQGDYVLGSVAMANSGPNTNGSQFFISLADNSKNLTKSYNLFGQVSTGMDVVQQLVVGDKMIKVTIDDQSK